MVERGGSGAVGKALRLALRSEIQLPRIEPRESGVSHLMNARRQRIFEYIAREPGVHLRKASREMRIPTQSLRWHLKVMARAGLLREVRLRGRAAYFCEGLTDPADDAVFVCLQDEMNRRILKHLLGADTPHLQAGLIRRLGSYEQKVTPHLNWMRDVGLLLAERQGAHKYYRPSPQLDVLRARYAESQEQRTSRLLNILHRQGLVPKVTSRGASSLAVAVSSGREASTMRFELLPLAR